MALKIRKAKPSDAAAIAKVHVDTWRTTYKGIVPNAYLAGLAYKPKEEMWERLIAEQEENDHYFVLLDKSDKVVGFVCGGDNRTEDDDMFDAEIFAIYILEPFQGKGNGRALLEKSLQQFKRDGFKHAIVWVVEANPACQFYEAAGGKHVAERMEDIGGKKLKELGYGWQL